MRLRSLKTIPRRHVRLAIRLGTIGLGIWLLASLAVAHLLTRRPRAPFAEPAPAVSWGKFESLRFRTRDGQEIGAWFLPGQAGAPAVLLLHGNGGSRQNCLDRAEILAARGHAVLLVSLRAHGDSTGEFNDIGFGARHDVLAAVDFLERRRPGRPVVVHGVSMGAATAVFASKELGHRVRGYILESPFEDLKIAVRNRTEDGLPPGLDRVAYWGLRIVSPLVLPHLDEISPVSAIGGIPADVPVLILSGGADRLARPQEAEALYGRVRAHGRLLVFDRAVHHNLRETDPDRYRQSILDFLRSVKAGDRAPSLERIRRP